MSGASPSPSGVVILRSSHAVAATVDRLDAALRSRGILVFARIDFSQDAARAGLEMRPAQLLIFGNPRAGTPLLRAAATVGLDLPLKAYVWEDASGEHWLGYNDPAYLVGRHGLDPSLAANLSAVIPLLEAAARA